MEGAGWAEGAAKWTPCGWYSPSKLSPNEASGLAFVSPQWLWMLVVSGRDMTSGEAAPLAKSNAQSFWSSPLPVSQPATMIICSVRQNCNAEESQTPRARIWIANFVSDLFRFVQVNEATWYISWRPEYRELST